MRFIYFEFLKVKNGIMSVSYRFLPSCKPCHCINSPLLFTSHIKHLSKDQEPS